MSPSVLTEQPIAVVAYPRFSDDDRHWIESIRREHDPQASRIAAHITLVFPCQAQLANIVAELSAIASDEAPLPLRVTAARAMRGALGEGAYVFLIPDTHASERLTRLHDRLYAGELAPHLRRDLPYVAHLTIAANSQLVPCEEIAQACSSRVVGMAADITAIEIIDPRGTAVTTLYRATLGARPTP